ncbi:flagellar hook-length control protein FliK [Desulfovibrio cuneatus]|uniref:flagellar hook-length control protein FliK n=1 Tax=Desulfovibrio cuneatus TaxID=159728 RepID=UPI00041CF51C|nr:flagellar hook-length control protein FliK [Desulfovibrio cuneatus]
MQFFPTDTSLYSNTYSPEELATRAEEDAKKAEEDARKKEGSSFSDVYSSFIEPGRTDYTGVPKGFSALDTPGSVLGRTKTDALRGLLQEGNAPKSSMNTLDDLIDSGKSMTVGRIFGALSGSSRASAGLDDLERADCEKLLKKLGFTTDESQELIQMGEEGKGIAAWKRISQKIEDMDESTLSVHPAEIAALLRSLDVSSAARENINKATIEHQLDAMNKGELKTLLAQVDKELGEKELAQQTMLRSLRPAIDEALKAAKLEELGGPSADMRAGSRNIASELRMRSAAFEQAEGEGLQSDAKSHEEHMEVSQDLHEHQENLRKEGQKEATKGKQQFTPNAEQVQQAAQKEAPKAAPVADPVREMLNAFDVQLDRPMAQEAKTPAQPMPTTHLKQEVFAQVEQGILQSTQNGGQQLTMQLSSGDLGKVSLVLSMQEGELKAVFKAENKESAAALTEQITELKAQLEENGIKVAEIDVQTNVREDSSSHTWQQGQHEHNFMQEAREQQRFARLAQLRREAGESVQASTATTTPAGREQGLHIVA